LSETPETAIPFLRQHLKPATDADMKEIRRHIADLEARRRMQTVRREKICSAPSATSL
jgi:hypothetical protein